jgi:hypothetical protein
LPFRKTLESSVPYLAVNLNDAEPGDTSRKYGVLGDLRHQVSYDFVIIYGDLMRKIREETL